MEFKAWFDGATAPRISSSSETKCRHTPRENKRVIVIFGYVAEGDAF